MAKNKTEKTKEEIEPEMMINPKAEEMCQFEEKNYVKCSLCSKTLDDQIYCRLSTMSWRLSNLEKNTNYNNQLLQEIINILRRIAEK
jgi:hypothetical protein